MEKKFLITAAFVLLALLGWSPWLTRDDAQEKTVQAFEEKWKGTIDGCGFNCQDCGVTSNKKVPFGYKIEIQFKCGMKNYFRQETYFVSFLGTLH